MSEDLSGKKVLITGTGKGIGRGIAKVFARTGCKLFLHYRSDEKEAATLLEEVRLAGCSEAHLFRADLADKVQLDAMFGKIREVWGSLDAAVNNAGWDPGAIMAEEITEELYCRLSDINIKGTLFCCLHEFELMKDGGSIINIGSVQMNTTVPGRILYASSKGAIHSMTGALALEGGPRGIRVNNIAPGYIAVDRMTSSPTFQEEEVKSTIPVRRIGVPEDIGELALFLASERSSFITGETIVSDGGVNRKLARTAR